MQGKIHRQGSGMPNTATQIGRENAKRQRSGDSVPSVKQWNGTTTSGQRKMPTSIWSLRTLSKSICPTKSSLAPEGKAVAFRLDPEQGFQWVGQYDISADELLSGSSRGHKMRAAQDFLKEILADGAVPQTEIETAAEKAGIKPKTLRNARYELGVVSSKVGRQWMWALPEE